MIFRNLVFTFLIFLFFSCQSRKSEISNIGDDLNPDNWSTDLKEFQSENNTSFWTESFNIPELTRLILISNENNPNLAAMRERLIAQGEDATIAGAKILPVFNANLGGSRTKRNLIGFNFPNSESSFTSNSFNSGLNISWELDLWGKIRDSRNSAKKRFEATSSDYKAARLSLNGQVAKSWFTLIENSFQIQLVRKTTETYSQNLSFINDRYQKGIATALEQKLAEASLRSSQATLAQRVRIQETLSRNLQEITGEYPSGKFDRNSSFTLPKLILPALPPTPSQVIELRYDISSAKLKVEASGLELKVANKNLLPSFTLTGGPGSRSDDFESLIDEKFRVWEVTGAISQPLFQGGRLRAGVRKSEALKRAALLDLKTMVLRAFAEVENALSSDIHLAEEEKNLFNASSALSAAADLSWERYQRGVEGIFNTLDTRRRAFEAESRYLMIKKERILNRIDLYLAIGTEAVAPEL
jgi:multidrug efflux system outer membrane protein